MLFSAPSSLKMQAIALLSVLFLHAHLPIVKASPLNLEVPYASQAPDGNWVAPWDEACEEASIYMIKSYYQGLTPETADIKTEIRNMIDWEQKTLQRYNDTNAEEIGELIEQVGAFEAIVVRQPSIEMIKEELDQKQPVLILVDMYALYDERPQGDSYHVAVLTGYDDEKQEFLLQDPARPDKKAYSYERVLKALHDYNEKTKEGDGEPTVLFTRPLNESFSWTGFFSRIWSFFRELF